MKTVNMPAGVGVVAIMTLVVERLIERGVRPCQTWSAHYATRAVTFSNFDPAISNVGAVHRNGAKSGADARLAHCLIDAITRLIWISQPTLV